MLEFPLNEYSTRGNRADYRSQRTGMSSMIILVYVLMVPVQNPQFSVFLSQLFSCKLTLAVFSVHPTEKVNLIVTANALFKILVILENYSLFYFLFSILQERNITFITIKNLVLSPRQEDSSTWL